MLTDDLNRHRGPLCEPRSLVLKAPWFLVVAYGVIFTLSAYALFLTDFKLPLKLPLFFFVLFILSNGHDVNRLYEAININL